MEKRRVAVDLGVTYETKPDAVESIPELLEGAVAGVDGVEFSRAHFKSFGDSALVFELVYSVLDGDYATYMDAQQAVNMRIKHAFDEAKIDFAYPTQTIFLEK